MPTEEMIPVTDFCMHHQVELSFIYSLNESGLIELMNVEEHKYLSVDQLAHIEKLVRLHTEMDINIAGIEAITHLLERIEGMQHRLLQLSDRLHIYEDR
jgi:hypothetical protein